MPRSIVADSSVGSRHGMLTVIGEPFRIRRICKNCTVREKWIVLECDCGAFTACPASDFTHGCYRSCGCDRFRSGNRHHRYSHGGAKTPLYVVWARMKYRCTNTKAKEYKHYGGKGVHVCDEWMDFECFQNWAVKSGYRPGLEVDRINGGGPYSPSNCRLVTHSENMRNTSQTVMVTCFGETKPAVAWGEDNRCMVNAKTLRNRLRKGWGNEAAITTPAKRNKRWHGLTLQRCPPR